MIALDYLASRPLLVRPEDLEAAVLIAREHDALRAEREAARSRGDPAPRWSSERLRPYLVEHKRGRPVDGSEAGMTVRDGVAILPVCGPISRYADWFTELCGGATVQALALDLRRAVDDPNCHAVLLHVDSPGGEAAGIGELAAAIREASARKPVCAYVSDLGCSAAYWLACGCPEIVAAETALLGSIGCVMGYRKPPPPEKQTSIEFVSSQSPLKRPNPETEAGKAAIQAIVDDNAEVFIAKVAEYRGVTPEVVQSDFGRGGVLMGRKAVAAGMADRVGSFEQTLADLASRGRPGGRPRPAQASADHATRPAATARLKFDGSSARVEIVRP